jgi:signal transduction histidine kinase
VRRSIGAAVGLIDDLVELARAEAGQLEIRQEAVDLGALVLEVVEEHRAQARNKGLEVEVLREEQIPALRSDRARIRQVLGNLLSNAVKFTLHGKVAVVARYTERGSAPGSDDWAVVDVSDTGPGIPEDKQHLLFEEFLRLEPSATSGSGLGLAISQRVVETLGGRITLRSSVGSGSTFTLWLPVEAPAPPELPYNPSQ